MKTEQTFQISGMHCNSCAQLIKDRLLKLDGINQVKASFAEENVIVTFDSKKVSKEKIGKELGQLGYPIKGFSSKGKSNSTLKEGIIYGLVPHIGCIGFIVGSVLGVTVAVEFFKPLLMNPWFFHILILIAIGFATLASMIYLRKNGVLSWNGVIRKKKYLATMYGSTVGINLVLFLLIFPLTANLDTGSFANTTGVIGLAGAETFDGSVLTLQVDIPCPGHAPLISGELKTIEGVTGVRFNFPNYFDVAFDTEKTSIEEILSLEVFETYSATITSYPAALGNDVQLKEAFSETTLSSSGATCGSCGGSGESCGTSSCGCGTR